MQPFPLSAPAFAGDSRHVPAGNAFEWLQRGWTIFAGAPGIWVVIALIVLITNFLLMLVPIIGQAGSLVLTPMIAAGTLNVCRKEALAKDGEEPRIVDLFWAFAHRTGPLATLGVIYMCGMVLLLVMAALLTGGGAFLGALFGGSRGVGGAIGGGLVAALLAAFVVLIGSVPLFMAIWFAPALVGFHDMAPFDALRASFFACLKNFGAITVFSVVFMIAAFFATLFAGLGWLVLLPILFGALYASYRDVFPAS